MRRFVSILLVSTMMLTMLLPTFAAAQSDALRVNANSLNVRSGPGTDFDVIASVKKDEIVTKLREEAGWVQIQLSSGATGWVSARFVEAAPGSSDTPQTPAEQPRQQQDPQTRPQTTPANNSGGGGGSSFGSIVKWTCLVGAAACAGLAFNEKSQGDDAYDEYKDLVDLGRQDDADDKFAEAEDHDDKAKTFWVASGGLFAAWFVGQFFFGGDSSDSANLSHESPFEFKPGLGEVRASVVFARF